MRVDLHTHSSASDGTDPPARVMRRAKDAGLDVVALTDHDTVAGLDEARRALPAGLTLVAGMELSCRREGHSVHLLAYRFDPAHPVLAAQRSAIETDRVRRARVMVAKLRELGVDIGWPDVAVLAGGGVVGRPHIARAMVAAGVIAEPGQAFTPEWIGVGGRAYASRYALDPAVAIGLVRAAGGVAVLAHPGATSRGWQAPDRLVAELAAAGLAGLETGHPAHDEAERRRLAALAADLDLIACGGSDDHGSLTGYRIGQETTPAENFERLMARAAGGGRDDQGSGPGLLLLASEGSSAAWTRALTVSSRPAGRTATPG